MTVVLRSGPPSAQPVVSAAARVQACLRLLPAQARLEDWLDRQLPPGEAHRLARGVEALEDACQGVQLDAAVRQSQRCYRRWHGRWWQPTPNSLALQNRAQHWWVGDEPQCHKLLVQL